MAKARYSYNEKKKAWLASVWDGTYNNDGSKHRVMLSSKKSSGDLEKKVRELQESVKNANNRTFSDLSFTEYAEQWLDTAKSSRSSNTRTMYQNIIRVHLSFLADVKISQIRHAHFQQAVNRQREHPRTCQQIYITFKQIVRSAAKNKVLSKGDLEDIITDISLPEYVKPEKRPLTAIEKEAFLHVDLDERKQAFLSLLYYCGMRREEALALTPEDFDWTNRTVKISKSVVFINGNPELKFTPKSQRGFRTIPLPEAAVPRIKPYADKCTGRLFCTKNGDIMNLSGYRRMWDSILVSLNIAVGYNPNAKKNRTEKPIQGLTAHIFRHNYCTELCYQVPKISTKMIAKLLGDTERMVLEVYSHIVEEKESVHETIENVFSE